MKLDFDPKNNITTKEYVRIAFEKTIGLLIKNITDLLLFKKFVKNWLTAVLFKLGFINEFKLVLKNGQSIRINKSDFISFWLYLPMLEAVLNNTYKIDNAKIDSINKVIKFKFKNNVVKFYYDTQKQLYNTTSMIKEQFIEEQYNWLDVKGKNVIDIGANIGDSAIYFALKGAKHVYAFEPYPYSYRIAMQNIRLNKLQDKITLQNEGCGKEKRKIKIGISYKNFGGTDLKNFKNGTSINITTLSELIKKFGIMDNAILKIDCEGCEYGVLLEAQNLDLKRFKQIQIEYHYGYLNLKRKLEEAGFKVSKMLPKYSCNLEAENKDVIIGFIYAKKS